MATIGVRQVVDFVLENPKLYPGVHNAANPRTTAGLPTLDCNRQAQLIWDGMCTFIQEKLEQGKSVNIPKFGAFTFEPIVTAGGNQKNPRGHRLNLRPCFLCGPELKETLYKYPGKEEVTVNPGSVYQQGVKMQYPNPVPIAAGTYYKSKVVDGTIKALFRGILDLSLRGYTMELDFYFAKVRIVGRDLHVFFAKNFAVSVQHNVSSWPSRDEDSKATSIKSTWQSKSLSKSMMNFHERPDSRNCMRAKTRTLQLSILSLDLNSATGPALGRSQSSPGF